jgi:hypothetical protein
MQGHVKVKKKIRDLYVCEPVRPALISKYTYQDLNK